MDSVLNNPLQIVLAGTGATIIMDSWALFLKRVLKIPSLDWAMVGRWLGNIPRGQMAHDNMAAATPVPGERLLGWLAHYLTGVLFCAVFISWAGTSWL